jgi:hypothetical protein
MSSKYTIEELYKIKSNVEMKINESVNVYKKIKNKMEKTIENVIDRNYSRWNLQLNLNETIAKLDNYINEKYNNIITECNNMEQYYATMFINNKNTNKNTEKLKDFKRLLNNATKIIETLYYYLYLIDKYCKNNVEDIVTCEYVTLTKKSITDYISDILNNLGSCYATIINIYNINIKDVQTQINTYYNLCKQLNNKKNIDNYVLAYLYTSNLIIINKTIQYEIYENSSNNNRENMIDISNIYEEISVLMKLTTKKFTGTTRTAKTAKTEHVDRS